MLVDDWKDAWKWWSVWGGVAVAVLGAAQQLLPYLNLAPEAAKLAGAVLGAAVPVLGALIPVLRVVKQ